MSQVASESLSKTLSQNDSVSASESASASLSTAQITETQVHSGVYSWQDADQVLTNTTNADQSATKQTESLPQTGNETNASMTTMGALLAGIAALAGFKNFKK
ncbi:LPXTG cell wall anchor domain-containing protein, partial [Limosilactobacillus gastricus]